VLFFEMIYVEESHLLLCLVRTNTIVIYRFCPNSMGPIVYTWVISCCENFCITCCCKNHFDETFVVEMFFSVNEQVVPVIAHLLLCRSVRCYVCSAVPTLYLLLCLAIIEVQLIN